MVSAKTKVFFRQPVICFIHIIAMTRCYCFVLFWLARVAGLIGLVAGGKSLVKYALARLKDPYFDSFSYNDLVFSGGVIFLLSLLVLILVELGKNVGRTSPVQPVGATSASVPGSGAEDQATMTNRAAGAKAEAVLVVTEASPDAKLARLLKQHED